MNQIHTNNSTGSKGEDLAVSHLLGNGYTVLDRNFKCRGGEVDIVARDSRGVIVFVEVKTRRSLEYGLPQFAVTPHKQRQIAKGALTWLSQRHLHDRSARFDVIAILLYNGAKFKLEHIVNAFELNY